MPRLTAQRTLVKSPPELWSELSELERLGRHLGAFGEIAITRLVPEHTVAWEGEAASGTVSIEPSGWGTKVTLSAEVACVAEEAPPEPIEDARPVAVEAEADEEPELDEPEQPQRRPSLFARILGRRRGSSTLPELEPLQLREPEPFPGPEPALPPEPEPAAEAVAHVEDDQGESTELNRRGAQAVLEEALEALGSAHHRPFSRG